MLVRNQNTTGYPPKSVYRTPLTTGGQSLVVKSGADIDIQKGGAVYMPVVHHTSNSTDIANWGVALCDSTQDIKMRIDAPVTGSHVKILMTSTNATDNAVYSFITTTDTGKKARFGSSGRTLTVSTNVQSKLIKWVELIGTTYGCGAGKASWLVAGISPTSGGVAPFSITTSTA